MFLLHDNFDHGEGETANLILKLNLNCTAKSFLKTIFKKVYKRTWLKDPIVLLLIDFARPAKFVLIKTIEIDINESHAGKLHFYFALILPTFLVVF